MGDDAGMFELVVAVALGELTGPDAERARSAVHESPAATALFRRLELVVAAMREDDSTAPPEALARRVRGMLGSLAPARPAWIDRAGAVLLNLLFDSRVTPVLGLRGGTPEGFQARFGAGDAEVDLSAVPGNDGRMRLLGQMDPPPATPGPVALLDTLGAVAEGSTDARGIFVVSAPPGRYALAIGRDDQVLMTPLFDLS